MQRILNSLFSIIGYFIISFVVPLHVYSLSVYNFGAKGNGITDDTHAIQRAIDSASLKGETVFFPAGTYAISQTLLLKAGVSLIGEGKGNTSITKPVTGSIIKNIGKGWSVLINGQNSRIRDLVIYSTDKSGSEGGIYIRADHTSIESILIENLLIYGFADGTALKMEARNSGGIAYCSFYDLRIRHAKTGIYITQDASSFVNSNSFYHGVVSGGGFDFCIRIGSGNNTVFNAMVVEPYSSVYGHLIVESGEIIGNNIRIEGVHQPAGIPLIEFKANTSNSFLTGTCSGGLIIDRGDNFIDFRTGKSLDFKNNGTNEFINSSFQGLYKNTLPYWGLSGRGATMENLLPELLTKHNVIKIIVPTGIRASLHPDRNSLPSVLSLSTYNHCNFGAYIKTNQSNKVYTVMRAPSGMLTGTPHPGDSSWCFTGMTGQTFRSGSYDPQFILDNSKGTMDLIVYVTTPTLSFGSVSPQLEAGYINSSGGIMTGTLSTNFQSATIPESGFLVLPKDGNVFEITGSQTLYRMNDNPEDRFVKGTIITLLFNTSGMTVTSSAYLNLKSSFISTANSSLTLISLGNGTWREMNRNL